MKQKTTLLVLGLTLAIVATLAVAPIVSEMAYARGQGNQNNQGIGGGNIGVNGGGTSNACSNAGAAGHNPHCNGGQTPSGQTITGSFNRGD